MTNYYLIIDEEGYGYIVAPENELKNNGEDYTISISHNYQGTTYHKLDHNYIPTIDWNNSDTDNGVVIQNRTHWIEENTETYELDLSSQSDGVATGYLPTPLQDILKIVVTDSDNQKYYFDKECFQSEGQYFYFYPKYESYDDVISNNDNVQIAFVIGEDADGDLMFLIRLPRSQMPSLKEITSIQLVSNSKTYHKLNENYLPNGVPYLISKYKFSKTLSLDDDIYEAEISKEEYEKLIEEKDVLYLKAFGKEFDKPNNVEYTDDGRSGYTVISYYLDYSVENISFQLAVNKYGQNNQFEYSIQIRNINFDISNSTIDIILGKQNYRKIDEFLLPNIEKDWDENDAESPNYIKNRTHYIIPEEECYAEKIDEFSDYSEWLINGIYYEDFDSSSKVIVELDDGTIYNFDSPSYRYEDEYDHDLIYTIPSCSSSDEYDNLSDDEKILSLNICGYEDYIDDDGNYYLNANVEGQKFNSIKSIVVQRNAIVKKLDKKYLPNDIVYEDEISAEKDWNENDSESSKYIQNRTHYAFSTDSAILVSFDSSEVSSHELKEDGEYFYFDNVTNKTNWTVFHEAVSNLAENESPSFKASGDYWSNESSPAFFNNYTDSEFKTEVLVDYKNHPVTVIFRPSNPYYGQQGNSITLKLSLDSGYDTAHVLDKKYLPSDIVTGKTIGKYNNKDWQQNDFLSSEYIQNRTHYKVYSNSSHSITLTYSDVSETYNFGSSGTYYYFDLSDNTTYQNYFKDFDKEALTKTLKVQDVFQVINGSPSTYNVWFNQKYNYYTYDVCVRRTIDAEERNVSTMVLELSIKNGSNYKKLDEEYLPDLTASDVGALPDTTVIPTKVSDLQNDSNFISGINSSDVTIALGYTPINSTEKGSNGGVAQLDENGKVPSSQLPSYVDDVLEYSGKSSFPTTGESGIIYIDSSTNITYRWGGSDYVAIGSDLALGETSSTAYAGDKGKAASDKIDTHVANNDIHLSSTQKSKIDAIPTDPKYTDTVYDDTALAGRVSTIEGKESTWDAKSDFSGDYNDLTNKPTIPSAMSFTIHEDDCTITTDATKGVAPYNTSYGMTYVTVDSDSGVRWVEGATYTFVCNTKLIVSSTYRNVAIRIGDSDVWHPLMGYSSSIAAGSSYLIKAMTAVFVYKKTYNSNGALHLLYDSNTTYGYLVNTIVGDSTGSSFTIDSNGYGARYSLIFPTTPASNVADGTERWSSPMMSSSTGTSKTAFAGKLYLDRTPVYLYSASVAAGAKPINPVYQYYTAKDLYNYLANTNSSYVSARSKVYMWLKNFDRSDMSFNADATLGNVMSGDKISTRFPTTVEGDVYLLDLGWNTATWNIWQPDIINGYHIYRYTPSTKTLTPLDQIKQTYTASEIGALPDTTVIPTKVSDLTNDLGYKTTDNNTTYTLTQDGSDGHKITLTPSMGSPTTITIPDNNTVTTITTTGSGNAITSITDSNGQLTATKGSTFLTEHQDISGKVDKVEGSSLISSTDLAQIGTNTSDISALKGTGTGSIDSMIDAKINTWAAQLTDDGTVNTYAEAINWIATHASDYTALLGEVSKKVDAVSGKGLSTNDYTTTEKTKLSGIAEGAEVNVQPDWNVTDTSSDAYIKNKPSIPDEVTESTVSGWGFSKTTGTYSKPSGGIPKTDLAQTVQTSLGLADTALQSYTETDPTVPAWAKEATKPTYTASEVGALPNTTSIPSALSDLSDDSTHRVVTDVEKSNWNNKVTAVSGKQLSTEDFTTELKTKLESIDENAGGATITIVKWED